MEITFNNYGKYEHKGDIIAEGDKNVMYGMSKGDLKELIACVKDGGVSKDDIDRLIQTLQEINCSQNDLTTEFAKMVAGQKDLQENGSMKKIREGVSFTSGMVTLGQAAIGIATKNPQLALPGILEAAKELV